MTSREPGYCPRFILAAALMLAACAAHSAPAGTAQPSRGFFVQDTDQRGLAVAPRTATVGTPRTIFVNGCTGPTSLDESGVAAGRLVVRINPSAFDCGLPGKILSFTPKNVGRLTVSMVLYDGRTDFEMDMETVVAAHATANLDGMWFDPDTSGSGISFHHPAGSDAIFGTWFLFDGPPGGGTKWYSLQGMQWTSGGTLLVGTVYEVTASSTVKCAAGDDCPRVASASRAVGSVGVTLLDANNLRVEAIDHNSRTAFVSFMKRLAF